MKEYYTTSRGAYLIGFVYLGEVANHMTALTIRLRHHIKQKGFHVIVERLVVQEQLG